MSLKLPELAEPGIFHLPDEIHLGHSEAAAQAHNLPAPGRMSRGIKAMRGEDIWKGLVVVRPYIRSSALKTWWLCRRKFLFRERLGLHKIGYVAPALEIGDVFHQLSESLCQGQSLGNAMTRIITQRDDRVRDLTTLAGDAGILPNGETLATALDSLTRDYSKGAAMAAAAWDLQPFDPSRYDMVDTEIPIRARIKGLRQDCKGRIDGLAYDRNKGEFWLVEYKTTTADPPKFLAGYELDPQIRLYRVLATAALPQTPPVGVIVLVVQKPTIKYCPNSKDSPSNGGFPHYIKRIRDWWMAKDAEGKAPIIRSKRRFRGPVLPPDFQCALAEVGRACTTSPDADRFFCQRTHYTCMGAHGNSPCEYYDLCHSDMTGWPTLLTGPHAKFRQSFRDWEEKTPRKSLTLKPKRVN